MKFIRIILIPDGSTTRQFKVPKLVIRLIMSGAFVLCGGLGFLLFDYLNLNLSRDSVHRISAENEGLKGEARLLMSNLEEVKRSLRQVQDYSEKLREITNLQLVSMSKKTGIGPLTPAEMQKVENHLHPKVDSPYVPLGIDMEKLVFRPVFDRLNLVKYVADDNALKLQRLLSNLSQKKSLLSSIPSIPPVDGWITSGFGVRISPFTGRKAMHNGVDVASPIGTPIYAPADGVVIFAGAKAGFGNFIMIAHGNGVISRYGHNAQNMVQPGQKVKRGEQIGTVGMTGRTTGPHLHYEILVNGRYRNPKKFMLTL